MWFALRTAPQREHKAKFLLGQRGLDVEVPTERRFLRRRGNFKGGERFYPMVIGYVLVRARDGALPWHLVFNDETKPYIKAVVGVSGLPAPIEDGAIERLRAMSCNGVPYESSINTRRASFSVGDAVVITKGPLRGIEAKIEDISECRASIVVEMLGKRHAIGVELSSVSAA